MCVCVNNKYISAWVKHNNHNYYSLSTHSCHVHAQCTTRTPAVKRSPNCEQALGKARSVAQKTIGTFQFSFSSGVRVRACVCVCVCVCVRARVRAREGGSEGGGGRERQRGKLVFYRPVNQCGYIRARDRERL